MNINRSSPAYNVIRIASEGQAATRWWLPEVFVDLVNNHWLEKKRGDLIRIVPDAPSDDNWSKLGEGLIEDILSTSAWTRLYCTWSTMHRERAFTIVKPIASAYSHGVGVVQATAQDHGSDDIYTRLDVVVHAIQDNRYSSRLSLLWEQTGDDAFHRHDCGLVLAAYTGPAEMLSCEDLLLGPETFGMALEDAVAWIMPTGARDYMVGLPIPSPLWTTLTSRALQVRTVPTTDLGLPSRADSLDFQLSPAVEDAPVTSDSAIPRPPPSQFRLYDIVQYRDGGGNVITGFVDALRQDAQGHWSYVVHSCREGVGTDCPTATRDIVPEAALTATGKTYSPCSYAHWSWPPRTTPIFRLYERVMVLNAAADTTATRGRVGFIADPPWCDEDDTWRYDVRFCPDAREWQCPDGVVVSCTESEMKTTGRMSRLFYLELTHPPRFSEDEQVVISDPDSDDTSVQGSTGTIFGRAQDSDGRWFYSVELSSDESEVIELEESSLLPTGVVIRTGLEDAVEDSVSEDTEQDVPNPSMRPIPPLTLRSLMQLVPGVELETWPNMTMLTVLQESQKWTGLYMAAPRSEGKVGRFDLQMALTSRVLSQAQPCGVFVHCDRSTMPALVGDLHSFLQREGVRIADMCWNGTDLRGEMRASALGVGSADLAAELERSEILTVNRGVNDIIICQFDPSFDVCESVNTQWMANEWQAVVQQAVCFVWIHRQRSVMVGVTDRSATMSEELRAAEGK